MTNTDIEKKAHEVISNKIASGEVVQMTWAVHEVIQSNGTIEGEGFDFYRLCAQEHVYKIVKKAVDKYDNKEKPDHSQMTLEGFVYLQKAYTVKRNDEIQLTPIDLMTSDERLARADEYDKQAAGCKAHAKELRDYDALQKMEQAM